MNRPTTALALVAATAALLSGCGSKKEADPTDGCKTAVTARYKAALETLSKFDSSKSSKDAVDEFQKALGKAAPTECDKVAPDIAQGITDQVALELGIDEQLSKLGASGDGTSTAEPTSSAAPSGAPSASPSATPTG